jgi:phospholipid/cholesterol/gamma-HCH transport system substrate-binding protein
MNNAQQTARVGLFFLLGVALIWVTYETLSGGKLFRDQGYTLVAGFDDVKDLKKGDDVRMAGVKIGSVDLTRLDGRRAAAVLRIDSGVLIPRDATATIYMAGLLGSDYVGISMGTSGVPPLADGQEIATTVTPDFNTIMTELGSLGKKLDGALGSFSSAMNGDGKGGGGLIQNLDRLVTDNRDKIGATLSNLQSVSDKINHGEGTLGKLVNDPDLHDQLLAAVNELKSTATQANSFMANAQGIVDHVKSGQGSLGMLLYDPQSAENLRVAVQDFRDVSDKLAKGQGTLGKLINDDSLYLSAQSTMKKADRALDGLNDSGPITAVGIVANSLF